MARRLIHRVVLAARADDAPVQLTRTPLGGRGTAGQDAVIRPMGADAVIRRSEALTLQPRRKPSRAQPT